MIARRALRADPAEPARPEPADDASPGAAAADASPGAAADPAALGVAAHAAQIADLLAAIDEGRPPLVTGESAQATLELICAVYESARVGRTVVLPAPGGRHEQGAAR
jgi:predicted dehydrogenase